jgi:hypothetical protein
MLSVRKTVSLAALCAAAALWGCRTMPESAMIPNVDAYRVTDPLYEAVRVVLTARGEPYSAAYVQGVSGGAFRTAGPCPCAPTSPEFSKGMETAELAALFGYRVEVYPLSADGIDLESEVQKVLARVREEVRAGRPVVLWHAFTTAEWDVVCGFDEEEHQVYGRGSYGNMRGAEYVSAEETRTIKCLDICPALGAIFIGEKVGSYDARAAELAALREAVRHARTPGERPVGGTPEQQEKWTFRNGLAVYDWWVAHPPTGWDYCLDVTRSRHRAAAGFMREIAPRYPAAREHLDRAARRFEADADALDECLKTAAAKDVQPEAKQAALAETFRRARENYAGGIDEIERGLAQLE